MAQSFSVDISAWAAKVEGRMDLVVRKIALDMFGRIVLRSPVDKGRFRGNWHVSVNRIEDRITDATDKQGSATVAAGSSEIATVRAGDIIYLINNLPYGPALERGHSKQAPAGMVGVTIAEFQQVVRASAAQAKREGG